MRSFVTLVDSIPSASLVHFTILFSYPSRTWLKELDWAPLANAIQRRLHWELSPGTRKVVRVAILANLLDETPKWEWQTRAVDLVPLVQSALQCVRRYADVEVVGGTGVTFLATSPVPHFPMVL
jgi:hypothetical protein